VFLLGEKTIPGARAAIGTAVHAAAEVMWTDAILTKKKDSNRTKLKDAAVAEFQEIDKQGLNYDLGEDINTAESTICDGVDAFVDDIVPFTDIPNFVEQRFTINIDHNVIKAISGTVDYISKDVLADVKTSKRKPVPQSFTTQQSIYKMLAEENGHPTKHSMIQGIVLKKQPQGHILELEPNIPRAKYLINSMLDVLDVYYEDKIDPEILFRGNPKYYLCSSKYCKLYNDGCPFVNGGEPRKKAQVVKL